MFEALTQVNWIAVVLATIATTILGGLWYTVLFGRQYAAALGRVHDPQAKPAPIFIFGPLVCSFATAVTSAVLLRALQVTSLWDGLAFGVVVGLGYLVATMTNTAINPNMPHPLRYSMVSGPFFLVTSVTMALILVGLP